MTSPRWSSGGRYSPRRPMDRLRLTRVTPRRHWAARAGAWALSLGGIVCAVFFAGDRTWVFVPAFALVGVGLWLTSRGAGKAFTEQIELDDARFDALEPELARG